jgi:hypothetical protein
MAIACVEERTDDGLPDKIVDSSTLSVALDNMGVATLNISIFTISEEVPTDVCNFDLGNGRIFRGFIKSDSPVKLQGTKYIEHRIVALGEVC